MMDFVRRRKWVRVAGTDSISLEELTKLKVNAIPNDTSQSSIRVPNFEEL